MRTRERYHIESYIVGSKIFDIKVSMRDRLSVLFAPPVLDGQDTINSVQHSRGVASNIDSSESGVGMEAWDSVVEVVELLVDMVG